MSTVPGVPRSLVILKPLTEASAYATCVVEDGTIIEAAGAVEAIFGRAPETLIGQPFRMLLQAQSGLRLESATLQRVEGIGPGASVVDLDVQSTPIRIGERNFWVVTLLDVTAAELSRRRSELEVRSSREYLDQLLDTANVLIVELDTNARVTRLNRMGEAITGFRREELLGRNWFEAVAPAGRGELAAVYTQALKEGRMPHEDENAITTADGGERIIAWRNSDIRDSLGEVAGILAFGIDVTPQRHAEAEWRITFDAVNTPILIVLPDGVVARVNRCAKELLHREFREIIGQPLGSFAADEPWITAARMVEFGDLAAGATVETKDGAGRTWDISVARYTTNDRVIRRILVLWEISSVVELQESLRRSETMSAMGTLVAGVAHEVRNPLFGISATLDAFAEELEQPELIEFGRNIGREVKRLTRLMQDLLEYGKQPLLSISRSSIMVSIHDALRNNMRSAQAAEVTVSVEAEDSLPDVLIDAGRMRQVFENLISNGIQHSRAGGRVRISVRSVERIGLTFIEASIEDEGRGFNPADLDRIFEPFFTRREGGTGLGLSIVQRIIEEHSGTIEAGNGAAGGAVITLWLPAAE